MAVECAGFRPGGTLSAGSVPALESRSHRKRSPPAADRVWECAEQGIGPHLVRRSWRSPRALPPDLDERLFEGGLHGESLRRGRRNHQFSRKSLLLPLAAVALDRSAESLPRIRDCEEARCFRIFHLRF